MFCDNDTNTRKLGAAPARPTPKTASPTTSSTGAATVNPALTGTKAAFRYHLELAAGVTARDPAALQLEGPATWVTISARSWPSARPRRTSTSPASAPSATTADEARVLRQASAGMLWCKQFYHYDVRALARRRPEPATTASAAALGWAQRQLDAPLQPRRHLHARLVGVPVVRLVGPRFPRRGPGSPRPRPSPSHSSPACAGSGTCTPTASYPPTNGTSATSTLRSRPGRP